MPTNLLYFIIFVQSEVRDEKFRQVLRFIGYVIPTQLVGLRYLYIEQQTGL